MSWEELLPSGLTDRYEVVNHRHAAEILSTAFPDHLREICEALTAFSLTTDDIRKPGGSRPRLGCVSRLL